jgi:hypothetical protein
VAGGFLFRTFARELVGLIPGFGWAVKGGIAYSGTMAMGTAAIAYFEDGANLSEVVSALTDKAAEAVARVRTIRTDAAREALEAGGAPEFTAALSPLGAYDPAPVQPTLLDVEPVTPTMLPPERDGATQEATGPAL